MDSLPLPKTQEEQFWEQIKLLRDRASTGDEIALQKVFCIAADSLADLVSIWRKRKNAKALAQAIFVIKDALDSLETDIQNPPKALLDLARKSHVWPVLVNPHPDEIDAMGETVRNKLGVGAETGFNYYGRKRFGFSPRKKIAIRLWDEIDTCRCGIDGRSEDSTEPWRKAAGKLRPSFREKKNFEAWWAVAGMLFCEKFGANFEDHPTIKNAFAEELKNLPRYKNKEYWNERNQMRNLIKASLRQEFETILPVK